GNVAVRFGDALYTGGATLISGVIAEAMGRDGGVAANAAQNAAVNNYLWSREVDELVDKQRACNEGDAAACARAGELETLDIGRNLRLRAACSSGQQAELCAQLRDEATRAMGSLKFTAADILLDRSRWFDPERKAAHALQYGTTSEELLHASGWTSREIAAAVAAQGIVSETLLGLTASGTAVDLVKAEDGWDYLWAILGIVPGTKAAGSALDALKASDRIGDALKAADKAGDAVRASGPVYKTTKEAAEAATAAGYKRVNETVHGQAVFERNGQYITRDVDGHNGGAWKVANSVKNLGSKATRIGTLDANFKWIGK
ncbi:MAG: toxin C-terminal domain-containing protein, partial [Azoarcus sp.]|nr:toxin C-terminal domain-containing protein [Azoarcus sp.]